MIDPPSRCDAVRRPDDAALALAQRLRRLWAEGELAVPAFGRGPTARRLRRLAGIAADDLALARLAEAHLDAVTILGEFGRHPEPGALYGVWASDAPHARLHLEPAVGGWVLRGRKAFCTGALVVDRALVTADLPDSDRPALVDIDASSAVSGVDASSWTTTAFADTTTCTIDIDGVHVGSGRLVGEPGWYLDRIGFWQGAVSPAACWAGGAIGLADHVAAAMAGREPDEHLLAHLGALDSARWELEVVLDAAGAALDAAVGDDERTRLMAQRARTAVERLVILVVDHAIRAGGPRLLAADPWGSRRVCELQLYARQHHDTRDHAALARTAGATRDDSRPPPAIPGARRP